MNIKQLKPASELAQAFGVKCLAYGPPGSGKTPLIKTAPRPVLCVVEPGMLSMRDAHNIPAWEAYTPKAIDEFAAWLFGSAEARQFNTVGIDSVSQMAEIVLTEELARNKDGRKAYGEMSRRVMSFLTQLYFTKGLNVYLVAKQTTTEENGVTKRRPYFPGQDLNVKVPHLFDLIAHVALTNVPGMPAPVMAVRTRETFDVMARDRGGKLAELEPPDLTHIFRKCMG